MGLFDGTRLERPVLCERCGKDVKLCGCLPPDVPPDRQLLKLRIEKRKRGKTVTVISGFTGSATQIRETFSELKTQCGAGGAIDGEQVELQGDQVEKASKVLSLRGYRIDGQKR
jgi:translation initiation factor 1